MTLLKAPETDMTPIGLSTELLIQEARMRHLRRQRIFIAVLFIAVAIFAIAGASGLFVGGGNRTSSSKSGPPARPFKSINLLVAPKQPGSLAVGPTGSLYIADPDRQEIFKRLPNGRFTIVAGTGIAGHTGDGGLATRAEIANPGALAVAQNGDLYFSQINQTKGHGQTSSMIREVKPNGKIATIAGIHPNCSVLPSRSGSLPAQSAVMDGEILTTGSNGDLSVETSLPCSNDRNLGHYFQLTPNGHLVPTPPGSAVAATYCGGGDQGIGFLAYSCMSGGGQPPRLLIISSDGTTSTYPSNSSTDRLAALNGEVVALHNGSIDRVTAAGLQVIATNEQLERFVPDAGGVFALGGFTLDSQGNIYLAPEIVAPRSCTSAIFKISPTGNIDEIWHLTTHLCN